LLRPLTSFRQVVAFHSLARLRWSLLQSPSHPERPPGLLVSIPLLGSQFLLRIGRSTHLWGKWPVTRSKGASQFSNATPRESPSRQISRHLRMLRKLSKDNSKFGGRTGKSSERMPAPTFVISVTQHDRTPICPLKNSRPPLSILVLAVDLRSFIRSCVPSMMPNHYANCVGLGGCAVLG
jgi:hypothetical protein